MTMKSVGVHPSQQEMQNLVGVEISALKSDWGALQAQEKGGTHIPKFLRSEHKLAIFHWGLGSITSGLLYFPDNSLGCTPMHPGAPWSTPAGAVRQGVIS